MKYLMPIGLVLATLAGTPATLYASSTSSAESTVLEAAQQKQSACTGKVTDRTGEPLVGASVVVKGTTQGTITNADGAFTLNNVKPGAQLTFSYVGYASREVKWNGQTLRVVLEDNTQLNEVVVVGYGTQKKVNVTGAVSMVGQEVIESRPVANLEQALQGTIPGLNLSQTTAGGELNSYMSINIRGTGTIGDGSNDYPLVLIDGVEGLLTNVNPNDIESVSVLKDAAAASIYGSRAAFGVILVTTKSGKAGKVKINYSGDVRFASATNLPRMLNSLEFANFFNAAYINSGSQALFSDDTIDKIKRYMNGEYTDPSTPEYYGTTPAATGKWSTYASSFANTGWFQEMYRKNAPSTQHNLSLSGGNANVNWLISGSFFDQNGLIRHGNDNYNRYTTHSKIDVKLADWACLALDNRWTRIDFSRPYFLTLYGYFYHNIARRWPTLPVTDPNGHYIEGSQIEELENIGDYYEKQDDMTQKATLTLTPLKGWRIVVDGAVNINYSKTFYEYLPIYYYTVNDEPYVYDSGWGTTSFVGDYRNRANYYSVNAYTDYERSIQKHNFKVLLGLNWETYNYDGLYGYAEELSNNEKVFLSQAQSNFSVSDAYYHRATAGYFGRLNYDYDGRYLLEANIRYDGSSRFLADKRWAWFPSFSAGWNMAREPFFEPLAEKLSTLKIRASWGQLGNTNSDYYYFEDWYPFYQQQEFTPNNSDWLIDGSKQTTASLPSLINALLTWETIQTVDVGLDWAAFNNRLTGSFDWYSRRTKDMIGPAPVLGSILGTSAAEANNCDLKTDGWELEIGWRDRIGTVNYNARFTLSDYQTTILKYPYDGEFGSQLISNYYNGKKLGTIWGYVTEGIAQTDEEMLAWLENNRPTWGSNWAAGDIMYKDLNGDGKVSAGASTIDDHGDKVVIGNSTPRFRVGLNLGVDWKGFDFSVFFQGVMKRDWNFDSGDAYFWGMAGDLWQSAGFKEHLDYWTPENTNAYYPRPLISSTKNQYAQTRYVQNAAYLRCKNLQVGYSVPKKVLKHFGASNLRVYTSVDNLFTITPLASMFDPEAISGYYGSGKLYPLMRTWSIGVSLGL